MIDEILTRQEMVELMDINLPEMTKEEISMFVDFINTCADGIVVTCESSKNGECTLVDEDNTNNRVHISNKEFCIKNQYDHITFDFPEIEENDDPEIENDFIQEMTELLEMLECEHIEPVIEKQD